MCVILSTTGVAQISAHSFVYFENVLCAEPDNQPNTHKLEGRRILQTFSLGSNIVITILLDFIPGQQISWFVNIAPWKICMQLGKTMYYNPSILIKRNIKELEKLSFFCWQTCLYPSVVHGLFLLIWRVGAIMRKWWVVVWFTTWSTSLSLENCLYPHSDITILGF